VSVGKIFGVIRVLIDDADIEVATFRNDGIYVDGRRPEGVVFSTAEEDAQRRDFTINALFYDLNKHQILDYVDGIKDLRDQVIKTVGEPELRFSEDHLRLLRAARFVAQLGFVIEKNTLMAIRKLAPLVKDVSGERLRDEFVKLLKSKSPGLGLDVMVESDLMEQIFTWWKSKNNRMISESLTKNSKLEDWQRLSLLFRYCPLSNLKQSLDLLKLSSKDQRNIEEAWGVWQDPSVFWQNRLGQQIILHEKKGIHWALNLLNQEGLYHTEYFSLNLIRQKWGMSLPSAFLNGEDVKRFFKGEKIGKCLQEAYWLQLEGSLMDRDQALLWLKKMTE
jgi:tRNA nucleotidyltransferase (CCA-adding enzyme)